MKSQSEIRNLIKQKRLSLTKEEVESLTSVESDEDGDAIIPAFLRKRGF